MTPDICLGLFAVLALFWCTLCRSVHAAETTAWPFSYSVLQRQEGQTERCTLTFAPPTMRKIIQNNGTGDDVVQFVLCPAEGDDVLVEQLALTHSSSDSDVLPVTPAEASAVVLDRVATDATSCNNITAVVTFDAMVGITGYRLSARDAGTEEELCAAELEFVVVGVSIYEVAAVRAAQVFTGPSTEPLFFGELQTRADDTRAVLSGEGRAITADYAEILQRSTKTFGMRVQMADGTNLSTGLPARIEERLADIEVERFEADASTPVQYGSECRLFRDGNTRQDTGLQTSSCGIAITITTQPSGLSDLQFMIFYGPYRDGVSTFIVKWNSLLDGDQAIQDEGYVNVIAILVDGEVPPFVSSISPFQGLRRTGGDQIAVVMDNVDNSRVRFLRVGEVSFPEISGSFQKRIDGLYEAKYYSQPGNKTNVPWKLHVLFADGKTAVAVVDGVRAQDQLSYSVQPLAIDRIDPRIGLPGDIVTFTGYFDGFDAASPNHNIFIGGKSLRSLLVVPTVNLEGTKLSFILPERFLIGASYEHPVRVVLDSEQTPLFDFTFRPPNLAVAIDAYGGSYDEELDVYDVSSSSAVTFVARVTSGLSEPSTFDWRISAVSASVGPYVLDSAESPDLKQKSLVVQPEVFAGQYGRFEVVVNCSVDGQTLDATVVINKKKKPVIGVSLENQQARSIAIPDVPVRVSAVVTIPQNLRYGSTTKVLYRWTYGDVTQEFSYKNFSEPFSNTTSTPARLGREFIISQSRLRLGNHTVSLKVYFEEDPSISGTSSTVIRIFRSPLVPVIGYGASKFLHCIGRDLHMTGQHSYDPDVLFTQDQSDLGFTWSCRASRFLHNLTYTEYCEDTILPSPNVPSFTVSKENLIRLRERLSISEGEEYYLLYSMYLTNSDRMSPLKHQIVEVVPGNFEVAKLDGLRVMSNRGDDVDRDRVPVYNDLIVLPEGEGLSWSFKLLSPASSLLLLDSPQNIILLNGYYDPSLSSSLQSGPLGIQSGTLSPVEEYELLISVTSSKPGVERGESVIKIRTEDTPSLIILDLPVTSGNTSTTFTALAQVNLDSSYEFLYFFYLVAEDGEEYCIDGCSGTSYAQFKLSQEGTFRMFARLTDVQGKHIFDESWFARNITVTDDMAEVFALADSLDLRKTQNLLETVYYEGDHGSLELLSSSLASRVRKDPDLASSLYTIDVLDVAIDAMHQIVQNSVPTTMASKSYVRTASRFVALNTEFIASQKTLYTLFSLVDNAIHLVPKSEAFDLQEELLLFYNLSVRHATGVFSGSSSRVRLRQFVSGSSLEDNNLLVDLYKLQEEHLTTVLSRDISCGTVKHVDTIVKEGTVSTGNKRYILDSPPVRSVKFFNTGRYDVIEGYTGLDTKPSFSAFTLAAICNPDQAKGIRGEATTFSWCEEVFIQAESSAGTGAVPIDPNQKRFFTIMETADYVWTSRMDNFGEQSDTQFLVSTNVTIGGKDGAKNSPLPTIENCYVIRTQMSILGVTANRGCLDVSGYEVQSLGQAFVPRNVTTHLLKNFSSITASLSFDGNSSVKFITSAPGVFGARGLNCPVSARKPILALKDPTDPTFVYVLLGGLVSSVAVVGVTWVATSVAYVNVADAFAV